MTKAELSDLVAQGSLLAAIIKDSETTLEGIKAKLIKHADGEDLEIDGANGHKVTVSHPRPRLIELPEDHANLPQVRKLAGALFKKLFSAKYSPSNSKSFRDVILATLPPARAAKLIPLCEAESKPRVSFVQPKTEG